MAKSKRFSLKIKPLLSKNRIRSSAGVFSKRRFWLFVSLFALIGGIVIYIVLAGSYSLDIENDQANRINSHRTSAHGQQTVARSKCLTDAAREWAKHMSDSGFLHHSSGKDASGTIRHSSDPGTIGLVEKYCTKSWSGLGENVAVGSTSEGIFNAFLASSTHHAVIHNPSYNLVGIGAYRDDAGRLWITQLFAICNGCSGVWTQAPGTVSQSTVATQQTVVAVAKKSDASGHWTTDARGKVLAYGSVKHYGDTSNVALSKPIVGMAARPTGDGYWLVASDGGIFAFGAAGFYGSLGGQTLNKPIIAMAVTPSGGGYWLVASDGGIFTFGNAAFHGSLGGQTLNKPIVGMAPTPNGGGYWLVASDGGIFTFGNAGFYGSLGGQTLNKPIVGIAPTPNGDGYWLVGSDGGVFTFGSARFYGSAGALGLTKPVVGMLAMPDAAGYMIFQSDGTALLYGSAQKVAGVQVVYQNTPPTTPGNLRSTSVTDSSVSLAWTASSDNRGVKEYRIFRNGTQIAATMQTGYTDTGLPSSTTFSYQVSAVDNEGAQSTKAGPVSVTTIPANAPLAMTYTSAWPSNTPVPPECVLLYEPSDPHTWNDNVVCANKNVGFKFSPSGQHLAAYCVTVNEPSDPQYQNESSGPMYWSDNVLCTSSDIGLEWSYAGTRDDADTDCVRIVESVEPLSEGWSDNFLCWYANPAPTAPSNFRATRVTKTAVSLAWNASTDNKGVKEYRIFRNGVQAATTTSLSYVADNLTRSTTYSFYVVAVDTEDAVSPKSTVISVTTSGTGKR